MRILAPWLTVLTVIALLHALRLRALAGVVALGWLVYCLWTWIRPTGSRPTRRD